MNHFERLTSLLDDAGVVYTVESIEDGVIQAVEIETKTGPKNKGYMQFINMIYFDRDDGSLIEWGIWE